MRYLREECRGAGGGEMGQGIIGGLMQVSAEDRMDLGKVGENV